jgi:hypothetical protein
MLGLGDVNMVVGKSRDCERFPPGLFKISES